MNRAPDAPVTEDVLLRHRFPPHQPLTAMFLSSIGAVPATPDCLLLQLPVGLGGEAFGAPVGTQVGFVLQLNRIGYADEEQQQLGLGGASFWSPVFQASGLQQGNCVCPVLSIVLGSARQLEALLVGLGCEVMYEKKEPKNGNTRTG